MAQMKMKPILKHVAKKLWLATKLTGVLAFTAASAFTIQQRSVAKHIEEQNYKTVEQIKADADLFSTDMSIATYSKFFGSEFQRLKHNDGEPIYVNIADSFSEVEKEAAKQIFNYYSNLFSIINPNYSSYEFVSRVEMTKKLAEGKTVIGISHSGISKAGGAALSVPNPFNTEFTSYAEILINPKNYISDHEKEFEQESIEHFNQQVRISSFFDVMFEEITHVFGLGDVYIEDNRDKFWEIGAMKTTDISYNNTFMNNHMTNSIVDLFPGDVKILVALYSEIRDENGDIIPEKVEFYQEFIDSYTNLFIENRKGAILEAIDKANPNQFLKFEDLTLNEVENQNIFKEFNNMNYEVFYEDEDFKTHRVYDYDMHFKDGMMTIHIHDAFTNELLETAETEYKLIDGVVFVDNLHLPKTKLNIGANLSRATKEGAISSFVIVKSSRGFEILSIRTTNLRTEFKINNQYELFQKYITNLTMFKQQLGAKKYTAKTQLNSENFKEKGKLLYSFEFEGKTIELHPERNL